MIIMKKGGAIICIIILLFAGLSISPAVGGILEAAGTGEDEIVKVTFWDCTEKRPVKQVLELTESEYNDIKVKLREIRRTSKSIEESYNAQFTIFKQYGLISDDVTYESLAEKFNEKSKNKPYRRLRTPLNNSFILNAICAINFEMESGDTLVFGLNTFMNYVGLNIISVHLGHFPNGITTFGGLLAQSVGSGNYTGFMFGFLGYWFGTKTGMGTYSEVMVAGFSVITFWFQLL